MPKPKFFESSNLAHVESKICDGEGLRQLSAGIYLLQINNRNTRKRYEICSKLTIKPKNFILVSSLLTLDIFTTLF